MLTFIWIVLAALFVLGGSMAVARQTTRRRVTRSLPSGESAAALLERTVRDVRPNDVVQYHARDYLVEGVLQYDEDGHTWRMARMADGGKEQWMLVGLERLGPLTVRFLDVIAGFSLTGYPPDSLENAQIPYKLDKRGTATVTFQGNLPALPVAGNLGSSRCRWWKYQAAGEKILLLEQWGETYRALVGESVPADDVDLLGAT